MTSPNRARLSVALVVLSVLACLDPAQRAREEAFEMRMEAWQTRMRVENEARHVASVVPEPAAPVGPPSPLDEWGDAPPAMLQAAVSAEIAWEPYAGVLRSPDAVARAKAGNAWDQALLMATLLSGRGDRVRYAFADLPDDAIDALLSRLPTGSPVAGTTAYDPKADAALRERVRRHVWVEVEEDGEWAPYDTTRPDQAGVWTPATSTSDVLPEDAWQRMSIAVLQRTAGGEVQTIGTLEGTVTELAAGPLSLVVLGAPHVFPAPAPNPADPTGLGEGLDRGISGLGLGAPAPKGKPGERAAVVVKRTFATFEGPQALQDWSLRTGDAPGQIVAEWLQITLVVPGEGPRVVERPLWEAADGPVAAHRRYSIGVFSRAVNDVDVHDARAAVEAAPSGEDSEEVRGAAIARFAVVAAAHAMDAVTDGAAFEAGVTAVRHQPRVYVAALETAPAESTVTTEVSIDLGLDEVHAIPRTGRPEGAAALFQRARGIASSTVEGEVLEALTGTPARTTSRVTQGAAADGIALVSLSPDDADGLAGIDLPDDEAARIGAALAAGRTVVVPERAVTLDGRPTWGWWEIDPDTGAYVGVMEGGGHQAVIEYSITVGEDVLDEDRAYVMGLIAGAVATEGLLALMAIKYEFAEITPEIAKEIAATLESIVCKVCPSAGIGYGGSVEVGTDCYKLGGASSGIGADAKIAFCDAYLEGVKCSMALVLGGVKGQIPGASGSSGGKIDIPFSCGGD